MKSIHRAIAEIKLSYQPKVSPNKRVQLKSADVVAEVLFKIWGDEKYIKEDFKVLFLDSQLRLIGYHSLSIGSMNQVLVDKRILFSLCAKCMACNIIISHNHPSCAPTPSKEDIELTKGLSYGCGLLNINLIEHIIVCGQEYVSMKDMGLIPDSGTIRTRLKKLVRK
ncbi:JAB domain-containing protein [Chitinophaga cymbidii]|uniref:MPN domain-containing protein n=1 Tax=Chitinophaga cymbidii TaxID=1096750 RepID=A0A512RFL0_9BACT|nr:JAB domain-containing protein [Chitinophaga cymbidii]GEP94490.1 hypothetical protein CCY01nite_07500 [Chitinophaga cymbidii]